jgi:hypothetical protein
MAKSPARSKKGSNGSATNVTTISASGKRTTTRATGELEEVIRRRAYEIYEQEGRVHGRDQEHWFRAESELSGNQKSA